MTQDQLNKLNSLRENGHISEEDYQKEKAKIFSNSESNDNYLGMDEPTYCMVLHLSQLTGLIIPVVGFIAPIVLWLMNKDNNSTIDAHGRVVLNWIISSLIYFTICSILVILLVGFALIPILALPSLIFIIVGALKAKEGIVWAYPLSIKFF